MTRPIARADASMIADTRASALIDTGVTTNRVRMVPTPKRAIAKLVRASAAGRRVPAPTRPAPTRPAAIARRATRGVDYAIIGISVYLDDLAVMDEGVALLRASRKRHSSRSEFLREAAAHYVAALKAGT